MSAISAPAQSTVAATQSVADAVDVAQPSATTEAPATVSSPATFVTRIIGSLVSTVLSPFAATDAPGTPVQQPAMWTLLAFARREFGRIFSPPPTTVQSVASHTTTAMTADTPTTTTAASAPAATTSAPIQELTPAEYNARFTGQPGLVDGIVISAARVITSVLGVFRIQLSPAGIGTLLASTAPPPYLTLGMKVQKTEFDGMPVYTLSSANPSGEYVVGVHGGAFTVQPTILHWLAYSSMVRDTGATVVVPIYPLANDEGTGGTAGAVIPQIADLISGLVDEHGSQSVSVYGDSAGGAIALASVQELVRRGAATPGHMVLVSPVLDLTMSNPNIALVKDPVLRSDPTIGPMWAGGLDLTDPLVSPIYGSLDGLPPTWVYAGSSEVLGPDVLRLQDMAIEQGADFGFTLRRGQIHDWALPLLPDGQAVKPDIYEQLGLLGVDKATSIQSVAVTEAATFTGQPSLVSRLFVAALRVVNPILRTLGIDLTATTGTIPFLSDGIPPFFLTYGLHAKSSEYNGWKVWTLTPDEPTGKVVVALHGGAFISQVNIFQWSTYADMARDTGATVVVPLYPLAKADGTGGTAATVVPTATDFIADQVAQHGAENVSVLGDSAGGNIALAAAQEAVRRCGGDPQCLAKSLPGHLVLIAPALDLTMSNPNIRLINDPLLSADGGAATRKIWAAGLGTPEDPDGTKNPLASPLYGSLEGLPPTTVYAGSLDLLSADVLVLQQKVASIPGTDLTFELRNGQIHDWIIFPFLPDAIRERPGLYGHLGIAESD
jgi:acetyl esterase/lipase